MNEHDALIAYITEDLYAKEPLAATILSYLSKKDPTAHREILDAFDTYVKMQLDTKIQETIDNDRAATVVL